MSSDQILFIGCITDTTGTKLESISNALIWLQVVPDESVHIITNRRPPFFFLSYSNDDGAIYPIINAKGENVTFGFDGFDRFQESGIVMVDEVGSQLVQKYRDQNAANYNNNNTVNSMSPQQPLYQVYSQQPQQSQSAMNTNGYATVQQQTTPYSQEYPQPANLSDNQNEAKAQHKKKKEKQRIVDATYSVSRKSKIATALFIVLVVAGVMAFFLT